MAVFLITRDGLVASLTIITTESTALRWSLGVSKQMVGGEVVDYKKLITFLFIHFTSDKIREAHYDEGESDPLLT